MKLPTIEGQIRRRILVNYRVDPEAIRPWIPPAFHVTMVGGYAMAGVCLIRLDEIRPTAISIHRGLASENVAYRVAVHWADERGHHDGVYIPRRDTSSSLQSVLGGKVFPGEYHLSQFTTRDVDGAVTIACRSKDGHGNVRLIAHETDRFPDDSVFDSLATASAFFENGAVGYSATRASGRLDGLELRSKTWSVAPLAVDQVESGFFDDEERFPRGSWTLDNALIMRNIAHEWRTLPAIEPTVSATDQI